MDINIKRLISDSLGIKDKEKLNEFYAELDRIHALFEKGPVASEEWAEQEGLKGMFPPNIEWLQEQQLIGIGKDNPEILSVLITVFFWGIRVGNEYNKRKGAK